MEKLNSIKGTAINNTKITRSHEKRKEAILTSEMNAAPFMTFHQLSIYATLNDSDTDCTDCAVRIFWAELWR